MVLAGLAIYTGFKPSLSVTPGGQGIVKLTVFDVGQGEASLLQFPDGATLMIDAAGIPFGAGFDIGGRVLAPALWAQGIRSLDVLMLTHGDPDHIGGADALVNDFRPRSIWQGIPVPRSQSLRAVLARAQVNGALIEERRSGEHFDMSGAQLHILHPGAPDWERQRVRNNDSIVLEVLYGDIAILMTGDIEAEVERGLSNVTFAPIRILKVAHHGSRTSSTPEFLDYWRPQLAIISCGRGNRFGHPAPEVIERLVSIGATVLRTDHDGQIRIATDGREVRISTMTSRAAIPLPFRSASTRQDPSHGWQNDVPRHRIAD
jgi:competence protein ComEC